MHRIIDSVNKPFDESRKNRILNPETAAFQSTSAYYSMATTDVALNQGIQL